MQGPDVLDTTALLAWLQAEAGSDGVFLEGSVMNSVNWSEVLQKAEQRGVAVGGMQQELEALGLTLRDFTLEESEIAAGLYPSSRPLGLSLADRACLATAAVLGGEAVTADRAWDGLEANIRVRVIR